MTTVVSVELDDYSSIWRRNGVNQLVPYLVGRGSCHADGARKSWVASALKG